MLCGASSYLRIAVLVCESQLAKKTIEQVQKLATRWIIGGYETYKSRFTKPNLPVTLYIEIHDVLYLTQLMLREQVLLIKNLVSQIEKQYTKQNTRHELKVHKSRLQKINYNFFHRSALLMKIVKENSCTSASEQERNHDSLLEILYRELQWIGHMHMDHPVQVWKLRRIR